MSVRPDCPRNAAFNKDRARILHAERRLNELREQGVSDEAAWDTIRAELSTAKSLTAAQRALLARICSADTLISLRGSEIRAGRNLVTLGLAIELDGSAWRLLPTESGIAIAKATGSTT